ncbi:hypothetical protein ES705_21286 [subsurface metagenome]
MVTLPGILSPISDRSLIGGIEHAFPPGSEAKTKLEGVFNQTLELVQPLASAETRRQLVLELDRKAQEYLRLKNNAWHLIVKELPEDQLGQFTISAYEEISRLIREDTELLGSEERELALDSIESLRDLIEAIMEGDPTKQSLLIDVLLECSAALQRADMCLTSILLVLASEIKRWTSGGIRLLCRAAREYVLQVEDIFLLHDAELNERLKMRSETVSLNEVQHEIGLRR